MIDGDSEQASLTQGPQSVLDTAEVDSPERFLSTANFTRIFKLIFNM